MSRRLFDRDPGGSSEFNSPKASDRRHLGYDPVLLRELEEKLKTFPKLTGGEPMEQKFYDTSHQVSDKSFSSDFERESCNEYPPLWRYREWDLQRDHFFKPPTSAGGVDSKQFTPGGKTIPITFDNEIPQHFSENLKQKGSSRRHSPERDLSRDHLFNPPTSACGVDSMQFTPGGKTIPITFDNEIPQHFSENLKQKGPSQRHSPEWDLSRDHLFNPPTSACGVDSTQFTPGGRIIPITFNNEIPQHFSENVKQKGPSQRHSPEWDLSRDHLFNPPTSACGVDSTQLSPPGKKIPITFNNEIPMYFSENVKQKVLLKPASPNNDNTDPSSKQKEGETDNFPPLVNAYLNDQINNIDHFQRQIGSYLLRKMNDFNDGNRGANYAENVLKYRKFRNNCLALPLTDVKHLSDKLYLKNKLVETANRLKYFKEQTVELSVFAQHAASWLDRSQEEITKQLKLVNSTMFVEQPTSTEKAENTNGLMLNRQNSNTEEKLFVDCSIMTSPVFSEDYSSSVKESKNVKEIENNRTVTISENNKKTGKVCIGTMTEKTKHNRGQSGTHKNLNIESSTEAFNSCDKKSDDLKKTCDANTKTKGSSRSKAIPEGLNKESSTKARKSCEANTSSHRSNRKNAPKSNSLNKTEVSGNNAAKFHSSDKKKQNSKCSSSITTTDNLDGKKELKKGTQEYPPHIEVNHSPNPKQDTEYTMTSNISDYESIVDSSIRSLLEDSSSTLVADESSSDELLQFDEKCSQASEEATIECGSSVNEESGSSTSTLPDLKSNTKPLHPTEDIKYDLEKTSSAGSTSAASSSAKESPHHGSRERKFENLYRGKDYKPLRTSSRKKKHNSRKKYDNRSSTSNNTSTTSSDTASTSSDEGKKNKAERAPSKVSKNIEKYGLSTPNLSFETKNYLDKYCLVMPHTKGKKSKKKEKKE